MTWADSLIWVMHAFNRFVLGYFLVLNTTYLLLLLLSLVAALKFTRRNFYSDYRQIVQSEMTWPISIVVAVHDEEQTIVETVRSLMMVNYGEFEIVVVNDGSNDRTLQRLIRAFDLTCTDRIYQCSIPTRKVRGVYASLVHTRLVVVDKDEGGKSDALNVGINLCRYPLFCSIDAGSVIEDNALLRVIKPFMEHPEETVAAGGVVGVVNGCEVRDGRVVRVELPDQCLPVLQVLESLKAFLSGRARWNVMQSLPIISGAFGVYKKQPVVEIGGYSDETDVVDLDLVVRLHRHMLSKRKKYRVVFVPDPVCWTEVPRRLDDLRRQRDHTHRGLIQTLWANRGLTFNPRYGALGMLAFPRAFLFEILGPFVETLGYLAMILSIALGIIDLEFFLLFFAVAILYGIFLSIGAVLLEEVSSRRYPGWVDLSKLLVFSVVENLGYRQLLSLYKAKALWDVIRGRRHWGVMEGDGLGAAMDRRLPAKS